MLRIIDTSKNILANTTSFYSNNNAVFADMCNAADFPSQSYLEEAGYSLNFSIKKLYKTLHGIFPKVAWRKLVSNNQGAGKWKFTLQMAAHGRLLTRDRISKWGIQTSLDCPLCEQDQGSIQYLFFDCMTAGNIWRKLLAWQGVHRPPMNWTEELQWATRFCKGRSRGAEMHRISIAAAVHYVWQEKNYRIFQSTRRSEATILRRNIQEVYYKASLVPKLACYVVQFNSYPT
ncbi:uncharacterized protein LOC132601809 [Lycium barbarum]|uniref:uncharacterized protein LOC132601809 n=1 Tax=Lycium barbarum TaxID=112863 RepID=UPI00293E2223|nr:uncharacterized protein LOC132601809 [Lycium barbarum]